MDPFRDTTYNENDLDVLQEIFDFKKSKREDSLLGMLNNQI